MQRLRAEGLTVEEVKLRLVSSFVGQEETIYKKQNFLQFSQAASLKKQNFLLSLLLDQLETTGLKINKDNQVNKFNEDKQEGGDRKEIVKQVHFAGWKQIGAGLAAATVVLASTLVTVLVVGGAFDYISGSASNPPKIVRSWGFDWLWRFFTQFSRPGRWLRILRATIVFPLLLLREEIFGWE